MPWTSGAANAAAVPSRRRTTRDSVSEKPRVVRMRSPLEGEGGPARAGPSWRGSSLLGRPCVPRAAARSGGLDLFGERGRARDREVGLEREELLLADSLDLHQVLDPLEGPVGFAVVDD